MVRAGPILAMAGQGLPRRLDLTQIWASEAEPRWLVAKLDLGKAERRHCYTATVHPKSCWAMLVSGQPSRRYHPANQASLFCSLN
ncbi:uncharacterized protein J3R85_005564 [Psidium guajava]|nr:uncharacterized protein J3R85_005564 [Psidium guajava]